jgi:hypothetical protein
MLACPSLFWKSSMANSFSWSWMHRSGEGYVDHHKFSNCKPVTNLYVMLFCYEVKLHQDIV